MATAFYGWKQVKNDIYFCLEKRVYAKKNAIQLRGIV